MPTHVLDTCILVSSDVAGAIVTLIVLAQVDAGSALATDLQVLLLPLLGALILTGGVIMLNPQPETRRIVLGRAAFGLFFGGLSPQIIGMMWPAMSTVKPAALLVYGGVVGVIGYILSKPFTRELYARADRDAKQLAERLEQRYVPPVSTKTVTVTETTPAPIPPALPPS